MAKPAENKVSKLFAPVAALLLFIIYLAATITGNTILLGIMWLALAAILAFLMMTVGVAAGIVVIKSLFVVAAELSLLIFVTQSYCSAPVSLRLPQNDAAMVSLFTIAIVYIGFLFVQSLWQALKETFTRIQKRPHSLEKWVAVAAFILFISWFIWGLYLIMNPIVLSLCVYR